MRQLGQGDAPGEAGVHLLRPRARQRGLRREEIEHRADPRLVPGERDLVRLGGAGEQILGGADPAGGGLQRVVGAEDLEHHLLPQRLVAGPRGLGLELGRAQVVLPGEPVEERNREAERQGVAVGSVGDRGGVGPPPRGAEAERGQQRAARLGDAGERGLHFGPARGQVRPPAERGRDDRVHAVGERRHGRHRRARVHVEGQVGGQPEREGERPPGGLKVPLDDLQIELGLARGGPGLEHVGHGRESHPSALLGRGQVGARLLHRGALRHEQRPVRQVLEVGDLDLEHDVLDRRVVQEARREEPLPGTGDAAAPAAEVEEQVAEGDARREQRLLHRGAALARCRLQPGGVHLGIDRGQPGAALGAVDGGGGVGVGPGEPGRRVAPEAEVHDLGQREAPDPLGQIGRDRRARRGVGRRHAGKRPCRRGPGHLGPGRRAPHARDARSPRAPRQEERRGDGGAPHRSDPVRASRRGGTPCHCTIARPIASAMQLKAVS